MNRQVSLLHNENCWADWCTYVYRLYMLSFLSVNRCQTLRKEMRETTPDKGENSQIQNINWQVSLQPMKNVEDM